MHPVGNGTENNEIVEVLELAVHQTGIRNLSVSLINRKNICICTLPNRI